MPSPIHQNPPPESEDEGLFAEAEVSVHSRAQALEEGVLVDVSEMAQEAGFVLPVAVTAGLWADIQAIPEDQSHQDVKGRLWDVLTMARHAIHQCQDPWSEVLFYKLILHTEDAVEYTVKMVFGPGDDGKPVFTLMRPEQD